MRLNAQDYADVLVLAIKSELGPVHATLTHVRDQHTELRALADTLTKELGAVRERLAAVEAQPSQPGPQGDPGPAGQDGKDGAPGTPGLVFMGVYQDGKAYDIGHVTTWAGSTWHCNEATTQKPGDGSKAWTLMVKRGRDGKDGRP
jgi:hypothetical protein